MKLSPENYFALFLKELESSPGLWSYYKFTTNKSSFLFRKNYFLRRLEYIAQRVGNPGNTIWDIGCGYGTTAIFLALNGYTVNGTTLEFYHAELEKRMTYWASVGDVNKFTYTYENLFDTNVEKRTYDRIIVQDTLHHIEPIVQGLQIIRQSLRPGGQLIAVEENGRNIIQRAMLYLRRGNKRIISMYDQVLKKDILIGNENIRPLDEWRRLFAAAGFTIKEEEYIRLFLPFVWNILPLEKLVPMEKNIWKQNTLLREYAYFGLNFLAEANE